MNPRRNSLFFGCTGDAQLFYNGIQLFYTSTPAGSNRMQVLTWDDFGDLITQNFSIVFPAGAVSTILGETYIEHPAGE